MKTMDRPATQTDQRLRDLMRTGRRASGSLSQRDAAERAGISAVYWQKIESGAVLQAPVNTLAAMCAASGVTAGRLREEGYDGLAAACDELTAAAAVPVDAEDHLAGTPGASAEEISALQAVWRALKAGRAPEPFEQELRRTSRASQDGQGN